MAIFGDIAPLCRQVPSYPWCNLFYRQVCTMLLIISSSCSGILSPSPLATRDIILFLSSLAPFLPRLLIRLYPQLMKSDPAILTGLSADRASAPVGVNPECGIPLVNHDGSIANIANIVACGLSVPFVFLLIMGATRRKAAVGKSYYYRCSQCKGTRMCI